MRPGCRAGSLRVSSCSRCASSRTSTLAARCRRIDASSVSLGPSSPPGSAHAPLNGSLARCHSRTCSLPSRTWSTTASASWLAGTLPQDSSIGYRLIIVNCRAQWRGRPRRPHAHGSDAPHASAPALRNPPPRCRSGPRRRRLHPLPPQGRGHHRHRLDLRGHGDPADRVHPAAVRVHLGPVRHLAGLDRRLGAGRVAGRQPAARPTGRPDRTQADLPGLHPLVQPPHRPDRAGLGTDIGLGGMLVVDPSLLAEYLPPQRRGRFLVLLDFFWPIGLLMAIGLSWVFLDRLGGAWRWLFVAAALPAFLAYVARRTLPESPYWLARRGRLTEAGGVLGGITGHAVDGDSLAVSEEPSSSPRELFSPRLRATSAIIILVWVALNVSYYGLIIWLPGVLGTQGTVALNAYVLLALVALAQFPGYAASLWLVEAWGRKPTLAAFLALGGVSALIFALAHSTAVYVAALFFVGFFNLGAWGAVYPYTSELFPTRLRSTAFGMVEGVGKAAAIAGPYLFGYLLDTTGATVWPLTFVASVMAAGALVTLLGPETRGAKLT